MAVFDMATDALLYYYGRALAEQSREQSRAAERSSLRSLLQAWTGSMAEEASLAMHRMGSKLGPREKRREELRALSACLSL